MASGDRHSVPPSSPAQPNSWAQIASSLRQSMDISPLHNPQILNKLKESTSTFIRLDKDGINRACMRFQHSLYGKLFGKPPPFTQVKDDLLAKWSSFGEVLISDLPNGFILIRCSSQQILQHLLLDGPWSVNGITLQLTPWKPFSEPTFAKLSTAAIWVQFHNLPIEFWDGETLDFIASQLGILLKIDDLTTSLARSKFARVCIDIDLSRPLSRGFWIGDDEHRVFVVVMYERLPTFCYSCGLISHGTNSYPRSSTHGTRGTHPPLRPSGKTVVSTPLVPSVEDQCMEDSALPHDRPSSEVSDFGNSSLSETDFGPWLLVSRRRGNSRGRGGGTRATLATPSATADPVPDSGAS
ncbi:uncharacterized protein LOC120263188 [Dioscorea cayenensis subsp. rotundata]|uniref:Uncharacterized protein LOC120263188 n=1 Tax=Dioscorea cayennensis subsp. rotundata TaxID=55577 RepID=A0AB40BKW2_DIOCR|nr:uncharacterized protein LOC120263188 [Dioscorea cayenensis subsp. rotundata]